MASWKDLTPSASLVHEVFLIIPTLDIYYYALHFNAVSDWGQNQEKS